MKNIKWIIAYLLAAVIGLFADQSNANINSQELSYDQKAMVALTQITTQQLENVILNEGDKNQDFLAKTKIRTFSDIIKNTDQEIEATKREIRTLIGQIATDIELNHNSKSGALSIDDRGRIFYTPNPNLTAEVNKKRETLLRANMQNNVSVRSAYMALSLLGGVNNELITQAKNARSRKEKEKLYMMQAVLVHEVADIVLDLLNSLTLDGKNSIKTLHSEAQKDVKESVQNINKRKEEAKTLYKKGLISSDGLEKELDGLTLMEHANERSLDAWKGILNKIDDQQKYLDNLKEKRDLVKYKRDKAKDQIATLRNVKNVAALKDSIGTLDNLVGAVDSLELIKLDDSEISALLGEYEE
jgi:hypothetical protein